MRMNQPEVRNPLVLLPAAQAMQALEPTAKAAMRSLLLDLSKDCRVRAEKAWRTHKGPMAAYWKAQAVYARHAAVLLRP